MAARNTQELYLAVAKDFRDPRRLAMVGDQATGFFADLMHFNAATNFVAARRREARRSATP